jgi:hypothetical protein
VSTTWKILFVLNIVHLVSCRSHVQTRSSTSEDFPFTHSPEALELAKSYLTEIVRPVDRDELIDPKEKEFFKLLREFAKKCRLSFDTFPNHKATSRAREYVFALDVRIYQKDQPPEDISVLAVDTIERVLVPKDWQYSPHRFKLDNPRYKEILRIQNILSDIIKKTGRACLDET